MKLQMKLLSPVHIGNNEELSPYSDYFYENGTVYLIDHVKFDVYISNNRGLIDELVGMIKAGRRQNYTLLNFINKHGLSKTEFVKGEIPALSDTKTTKIRRTICSGNNYFIPGSSIKGAIRTALLYDLKKDEPFNNQLLSSDKNKAYKRKAYIGADKYGAFLDDAMKHLQVSDTSLISQEVANIFKLKRISIKTARENKQSIPTIVEAIIPESLLTLNLKTTGRNNNNIPPHLRHLLMEGQETNILKCINEFSSAMISYEINALKQNQILQPVMKFYNSLKEKLQNVDNKKEALLRLGYGKTFYDNTIDLLYHNDKTVMSAIKNSTSNNPQSMIGYSRRTGRPVEPFPIGRWVYLENENPEGVMGWVQIRMV